MDELELTILMPCLNEQKTVAECVRQARQFLSESGICGEVLVADNGSTDNSASLEQEAGAAEGRTCGRYGTACGISGTYSSAAGHNLSYLSKGLHIFPITEPERIRREDICRLHSRKRG